ncbi:GNAT family N-acetyltransferase [Sinosporangium siamense]|uniref:N-acetyltransferase n=1 Tax=Sinosporangium siamense TaxID=1367973 RepID=A0A919RH22_9ACTN|nr:GNAT family N-acetyltransferase [Sinosporangium siamense]GII93745.1 N-acetyltransferase [Sinosporangium siamense]
MTEIIRVDAAPGVADTLGSVIATAFHPGDVNVWCVPDPEERERLLPPHFAILVEHALIHGDVYATADMTAVAVWFPNIKPMPDVPDYDNRIRAFAGPHARRLIAIGETLAAGHPHEPHHYLNFLAVLPELQGRNIGAALMAKHHAVIDAEGVPAYLEASGLRSRDFYLRLGYHDHGDPIVLPEDGPLMYPMWRPPAA